MYRKINNYRKIKLENYRQYQQYKKDKDILSKEEYKRIKDENMIFLITYKEKLYGIFTLREDEFRLNHRDNQCIKIDYLYIFEKYRSHNLATSILNDVEEVVKNFRFNMDYILVDTPIIYSMFYLDRGFKFYRAKKGIRHNQVTLFKEVEKN